MAEKLARDIMTRDVIVVEEDMTVPEVARLLASRRIGGAPVVDRKGRLAGVVSASDIVAKGIEDVRQLVSESEYYGRPDIATRAEMRELGMRVSESSDTPVREIMTPVVISVPPDAPISRVAEVMGVSRIHRVLVTEEGLLCGVVSALDLLGHVGAGERRAPGPAAAPGRGLLVLWATDLGPGSEPVGRHAVRLAHELAARLRVLHVTPDLGALWRGYGEHPEVVDLQQGLESKALDRLHDLVRGLRHELPDLEVTGLTGDPARVILAEIVALRPDYVVIGARRPDSERLRGLGSVAETVLARSVSPVVTVPGAAA